MFKRIYKVLLKAEFNHANLQQVNFDKYIYGNMYLIPLSSQPQIEFEFPANMNITSIHDLATMQFNFK